MEIELKRIYDEANKNDGYRVLVDRLWPRGISKNIAHLNEWNKNLAPSQSLRKWFHHDPKLWDDFQIKYHTELAESQSAEEFINRVQQNSKITLVFAAKDQKHCHAIILKMFLEKLIILLK